jgi:Protein kinase domain
MSDEKSYSSKRKMDVLYNESLIQGVFVEIHKKIKTITDDNSQQKNSDDYKSQKPKEETKAIEIPDLNTHFLQLLGPLPIDDHETSSRKTSIQQIIDMFSATHIINSIQKKNEIQSHNSDNLNEILADIVLMLNKRECLKSQFQQLNKILFSLHNVDITKLRKLYRIGKGGEAKIYRYFDTNTRKSYIKRKIQFKYNASDEILVLIKLLSERNRDFMQIFHMEINENDQLIVYIEYGLGDLRNFLMFLTAKNMQKEIREKLKMFLCCQIYQQAKSLKNVHIYHRDIKPGNIIITETGQIK